MNKISFFDVFKNKLKDYFRFIMLILPFGFIISLANNLVAINKSQDKIQEAEELVNALKEENDDLESRLKVVESDFYVETELRDSLGMAKEGEIVVVLPETDVLRKLAPKIDQEIQELPDLNWKKWLKLFFEV